MKTCDFPPRDPSYALAGGVHVVGEALRGQLEQRGRVGALGSPTRPMNACVRPLQVCRTTVPPCRDSYCSQNSLKASWSAFTLENPRAEAAASKPPNWWARAETLLP